MARGGLERRQIEGGEAAAAGWPLSISLPTKPSSRVNLRRDTLLTTHLCPVLRLLRAMDDGRNTEAEREASRLWRAWRTAHEMVADRVRSKTPELQSCLIR